VVGTSTERNYLRLTYTPENQYLGSGFAFVTDSDPGIFFKIMIWIQATKISFSKVKNFLEKFLFSTPKIVYVFQPSKKVSIQNRSNLYLVSFLKICENHEKCV